MMPLDSPDGCSHHAPRACASPRPVSRQGLDLFFDRVLERLMHEREIGIHPLQACILLLEVLDAFELADAQAAVFRLPVVERRVADPRLTAEVAHLLTRLMPAKKGNDLGLAESGSLHDSKVRIDLYFRMGEDQGSLQGVPGWARRIAHVLHVCLNCSEPKLHTKGGVSHGRSKEFDASLRDSRVTHRGM